MTWLLEDPLPILFAGLAVAALFVVAFFQSGRVIHLLWLALVVLLFGGLLLVEQVVVTEKEAIENALYEVAEVMEANDVEAAMCYLAPSGDEIRNRARSAMATYRIKTANVGSDLKVVINPLANPRRATATFTGRIEVADPRNASLHSNFVSRFEIELVHQKDRWLLANYKLGQ